jgi:hypothetical protein
MAGVGLVHFCTSREDVNVVPIPPHAFNLWSLSASGMAAELARSLATEKQLRVTTPGVWLIGKLHIGKTRVPVFFWPGLARLDPTERAARVQSMHPSRYVILVPSVVPDDVDDERAVVFSLASVLDVEDGDLTIAGDDLVAPFLETRAAPVKRFPLPPGTPWEAITIRFVSDDDVQILACGHTEVRDFAAMGMSDQRTKQRNESWVFLRLLAERDGTTGAGAGPTDDYQRTKVHRLRRPLKAVFGLKDDPFRPHRSNVGWVLRPNLKDARRTA